MNLETLVACYHCGETTDKPLLADGKYFCCSGCKMVYEILNQKGLCDYYTITHNPGLSLKEPPREDKFRFLDDEKIQQALINFKNETETHIVFYLPQIHCSSCLWLLENLHRLNENIISSKVDFTRKEVYVVFNNQKYSVRKLAELLTSVGYEPYISLNNLQHRKPKTNRSKIFRLGVAGFCFANIMLLSFPEYFGINSGEENLLQLFRYANLVLSLPVLFYSAGEFYNSAWKSLKKGFLNIDAPIVLAIWVTFIRSLYEMFVLHAAGYFDSMTGIVFFMLIGRVLQSKTYDSLNFERDYTSYFPISVTKVMNDNTEAIITLPDIQLNDTLRIRNNELIPADGILTRGTALIDYSFVTGESVPVKKEMGDIIYAGGKQLGNAIEILVIKEVAQSYLTRLWNRQEFKKDKNVAENSFTQIIARSFTWVVLFIAAIAAIYWYKHNPNNVWPAVTSVLIIACPCALLLSNTFTNGNVLRILSRNGLYLRNAQTIEEIANANHIVFDKTGTLTTQHHLAIKYEGEPLDNTLYHKIAVLAAQSSHPLSKAIAASLHSSEPLHISAFKEVPGKGIEGIVEDDLISLGAKNFVYQGYNSAASFDEQSVVYVAVENELKGKFVFQNEYRKNIEPAIQQLKKHYCFTVLSGDNNGEQKRLEKLFGKNAMLLFRQQPEDKLTYIQHLQQKGGKVIMLGDGLNDAGALKQANAGIAVTDNANNFTPSSDAIIAADKLSLLPTFIRFCKTNKKIVLLAFTISVIYNIIGIYFAVQATLSPLIAAILMPSSSISIIIVTYGFSSLAAKKLSL